MVDFSQFFSPAAWGSWNQPSQSMIGPKPQTTAPTMAPVPGMNPAGGGAPAAPGPGGGGNPLAGLFGGMGGGGGGGPLAALMSKLGGGAGSPMNINPNAQGGSPGGGMMSGISGNPMLAKFGSALMGGQNPLQAMMSNPGDFAKWAAQRRAGQPGQMPTNPVGNPQPPVPTMNPGMLSGMY